MVTHKGSGVPGWVTVREAAFLTGRSVTDLSDLVAQRRVRSTAPAGSTDARLLLISTAELIRLGILDPHSAPGDGGKHALAFAGSSAPPIPARWGKVAAVALLFVAALATGPITSPLGDLLGAPVSSIKPDKGSPPCHSSSPNRSCEQPAPSPEPSPSTEPSPDHQPTEEPPPDPAPTEEPSPDPSPTAAPPPSPPATRTVTGYVAGGFTVPAGETWSIDGTVETNGNVVVHGTLVMRPGDTLRFVNVDESKFVGGNTEPLATDVGLWVEGAGVLDARGTPKAAWNRTGTDPSWRPTDELIMTPTATGDFGSTGFASFSMGSSVPEAEGNRAEVLNLTRDVRIEGTVSGRAHVMIRSSSPQLIEYVAIRYMGPQQPNPADPKFTVDVAGRNPLHFHMSGDGSRGSVVRGVVVRDAGAHAFVPHMSHGITFEDTIAYNVWNDAYWWPLDHATHDTTYQRAVAAFVRADGATVAVKNRLAGFTLPRGDGNSITDSVAVGVQGSFDSSGFHWPELRGTDPEGVWVYQGNVAHNNLNNGIFTWQNGILTLHTPRAFLAYNNRDNQIEHGAYLNNYHYSDMELVGGRVGLQVHALSRTAGGIRFDNLRIRSPIPVRMVKHHRKLEKVPQPPTIFSNITMATSGTAVVFAEGTGEPSTSVWYSCTVNSRPLSASDFDLSGAVPGTTVVVYNSDGSSFTLSA